MLFDTRGEFSAWLAYASYAACAADPETARETEIIKKWDNSEISGGPVLLVIGFTSQLSFLVQYSSIFFAFDAISDAARVLRSIFTLRQTQQQQARQSHGAICGAKLRMLPLFPPRQEA